MISRRALSVALVIALRGYAQDPEWENYTSVEKVFSLVSSGDALWLGSHGGGLLKLNKVTEELTYFTHADGNLPGNHVSCLALDSAGYVWIGTQFGGVGRFDGATCANFNTQNSPLPSDQWNSAMDFDTAGNLWLASYDRVARFDGTNWTIFETEIFPINSIRFDKQNNGWVGGHGGLAKISHDTLIHQNTMPEISAIEIDPQGRVWMGMLAGNGLIVFDGISWTQYDTSNSEIPSNTVCDLHFDEAGNLWLATLEGLAKFTGTTWQVFDSANAGFPKNDVYSLEIDGSTIWLGHYDASLSKFDTHEMRVIKSYRLANTGIRNDRVESLAEDLYHNKWISSYSSVTRFDGREWITYDKTNLDSLDMLLTRVYDDGTTRLWRGAGVTVLWQGSKWTVSEKANTHQGGTLKEDASGNIWVAGNQGLHKFDGSRWSVYDTSSTPLPENRIHKIAFDRQGNLFVSTLPAVGEKGVTMKFNGAEWSMFYTCEANNYCGSAIEVDSSNVVWMGVANTATSGVPYGGGLKKFDGIQWTSYDITNSGLSSNSVTELCLDRDQNLWIGTYGGGCARFDRMNQWTVYDQWNSGLPWNGVEKISVDRNGNKWFGVQMHGLTAYREGGIILTAIREGTRPYPSFTSLSQNYPNPFNPTTVVRYQLSAPGNARLVVHDLLGREVAVLVDEKKAAEIYEVEFDGSGLSSGVYFCRMQAGNFVQTRRLLLLK